MRLAVSEAARQLGEQGLLQRGRGDDSERIICHVARLLDRELPVDLAALYRERILGLGDFRALVPIWNDHVGWRTPDSLITQLLHASAVPLFYDGCGSLFGLDLTPGVDVPAVYFFDHEDGYARPRWAAGSSLGAFMLILGDWDRACAEGWPKRWPLKIDPDIEQCPRAPALWCAD